jgi:ribosomal protein S18 acetylase RimI-like enzyme
MEPAEAMALEYTIRPAIPADLEVLVDFTLREAHEAEGLNLSVESATRGVRAGFGPLSLSSYWIAQTASGSVVASTSIVKEWSNFRGGHYWWIQSLYIDPDHRGTGLVELLIGHLTAACRSAGALDLRLYVHRSNQRAIRAYKRCGFAEGPYVIMTLLSKEG